MYGYAGRAYSYVLDVTTATRPSHGRGNLGEHATQEDAMAAIQGIGSVYATKELYPRSSKETEDLRLFGVRVNGVYRDLPTPGYTRTGLGALTAGVGVGGSMRIRGGSL